MTEGDLHIAWLVTAPVCLLTDILAVLVVCHFRSYLHGTDIVIISLIVSMAANAALVVPLPAALGLTEKTWTADLCRFYIWFSVMLRVVQLVHTTMLSVHWVSVLKLSSQKSNFSTTFTVKMSVPITWVFAGIIGLLPIIGNVSKDFSHQGQCKYFIFDLSVGFEIFMVIFSLVCMITALCSVTDALVILQHVRRVAARKYGRGNIYVPRKEPEIDGGYTVHERYSQLNFACDMCRLICVTVATSYCLNHVPYLVIQFLQISGQENRELFQHILLSLMLVESLTIPHVLWLSSKRYRHALQYLWREKLLRKPGEDEDDPSSCTLQSYRRRIKRNSVTTNLNQSDVSIERSPTSATRDVQAKLRPTSGASDYAEIHKQSTNGETGSEYTVTTVDLLNVGSIKNIDQKVHSRDLKRSLSGSSRNEWKEQMRKKHLPAIFVNEAFDAADVSTPKDGVEQPNIPVKHEMDNSSLHSMYYYMSSDYHPDYLITDSLPRHVQFHKSEAKDPSSWPRNTVKDISDKKQQRNNLSSEHLYRGRIHDLPMENGSLPRKKVPKMGTKCPDSGSNSSIYSRTHSRSTSENSLQIQKHYRSASDFVPYGFALPRGGGPSSKRSLSCEEQERDNFSFMSSSQSLKDIRSCNEYFDSNQTAFPDRSSLYIQRKETDNVFKTYQDSTLPLRQDSDRSESEAASAKYNESDIEMVLGDGNIRGQDTSGAASTLNENINTTYSISRCHSSPIQNELGDTSHVTSGIYSGDSLDVSEIDFEIKSDEKDKSCDNVEEKVHASLLGTDRRYQCKTSTDKSRTLNRQQSFSDIDHERNVFPDTYCKERDTIYMNTNGMSNTQDDVILDARSLDLGENGNYGNFEAVDSFQCDTSTTEMFNSADNIGNSMVHSPYTHDNEDRVGDKYPEGEEFNMGVAISPRFDMGVSISPRYEDMNEIDKGFEDALNASYTSRESLGSADGVNFDSVSDSPINESDPFCNSDHTSSDEFRTEAIVYRSLSHTSLGDGDFESSNNINHNFNAPRTATAVDSGLANSFESETSSAASPWPECKGPIRHADLNFENHFDNTLFESPKVFVNNVSSQDCDLKQDIDPVYF